MIAHSTVLDATVNTPLPFTSADPQSFALRATLSDALGDWPGRPSATIHFYGCDLACAYCCSPEFACTRAPNTSTSALLHSMRDRIGVLQGVVLSGGEPTLATGVRPLLEQLRELGLPAKIDTNGTSPDALEGLLADDLVSFVALDIKALPSAYDRVTRGSGVWERVERSIRAVIDSGVDHEFRTTCYPFAIPSADLPQLAARLVGGKRYVLQQFRPRRTLDPAATTVIPYAADELRRAALRCTVHLPTVVRGV